MEKPDKWVVVKIHVQEPFFKVFASWYGGYADGDRWRINSGIKSVTEEGDYYLFHGHSGSIYKCHKESYGTNNYSAAVLQNMIDNAKENGLEIEILSPETNFLKII